MARWLLWLISLSLLPYGTLWSNQLSHLRSAYKKALRQKDYPAAADALRKIGDLNTKPAAAFLLSLADKEKLPDEVYQGLLDGFSAIKEADVQGYLFSRTRSENWRAQLTLLRACARMEGDKPKQFLLRALSAKEEALVRQAVESLAARGDATVVDALIDLLEAQQKQKGLLWLTTLETIKRLTRSPREFLDAADWRNWWHARGKKPLTEEELKKEKGGADEKMRHYKTSAPQFFGREIASRRVVFVMDVSGSMELGKPSRLKRVQQELKHCVERLPQNARFNIIAFNHKVLVWQKHLVRATKKNKKKARNFIDSFVAEGQTHTDEALQAAFSIKDVDNIILLSDGAPYKLEHGETVSVKFIQEILEWVREENRFRKVRIDTFGFEEVAQEEDGEILVEFLKKLAQDNGGVFTNIK